MYSSVSGSPAGTPSTMIVRPGPCELPAVTKLNMRTNLGVIGGTRGVPRAKYLRPARARYSPGAARSDLEQLRERQREVRQQIAAIQRIIFGEEAGIAAGAVDNRAALQWVHDPDEPRARLEVGAHLRVDVGRTVRR